MWKAEKNGRTGTRHLPTKAKTFLNADEYDFLNQLGASKNGIENRYVVWNSKEEALKEKF